MGVPATTWKHMHSTNGDGRSQPSPVTSAVIAIRSVSSSPASGSSASAGAPPPIPSSRSSHMCICDGPLRRSWRDGRVKLHVAAACLRARRGPGGSVLAFARRATSAPGASHEGTVVPLPESVPRLLFDAVSGRRVAVVAVVAVHDEAVDVPDALAALPVTLLVAGPGDPN